MGLVNGRMSFAGANPSRAIVSGDAAGCNPSKTKPECRPKLSGGGGGLGVQQQLHLQQQHRQRPRLRQSSSSSGSPQVNGPAGHSDDDNSSGSSLPTVRMTRQASRLMAEQSSSRRSVRVRSVSRGSHNIDSPFGPRSLPSTLRRSARIAGVRMRPTVGGGGGAHHHHHHHNHHHHHHSSGSNSRSATRGARPIDMGAHGRE